MPVTASVVKVGMVGSSIQTRPFVPGSTLEQAIKQAGFNPQGFDAIVNGSKVTDLTRAANPGDMVILSRQVKGNALGLSQSYATVTLVTPDGEEQDQLVDPSENPTVATVLDQAGIMLAVGQAVNLIFPDGSRTGIAPNSRLADSYGFRDGFRLEVVPLGGAPAPTAPTEEEPEPVEEEVVPVVPFPPVFEITETDPAVLRTEAEALSAQATANRTEAERLTSEADQLDWKAQAYRLRADQIEQALAEFNRAKGDLRKFGVPAGIATWVLDALRMSPATGLRKIAAAVGAEVGKRATKEELLSAIFKSAE